MRFEKDSEPEPQTEDAQEKKKEQTISIFFQVIYYLLEAILDMKYLILTIFSIILLLNLNVAYAYTAKVFDQKFGKTLEEGERFKVLVKVVGKPQSQDPDIRSKEIRYLQASVLKFCHYAKATNVKSDTWENQFTAGVTPLLAEVLSSRHDVISVQKIDDIKDNEGKKDCSNLVPGADLSGCDLYGVRIRNADLRGINLSYANLKAADFTGSNLSGANLNNAFLRYATLDKANLSNADLSYSKMWRAFVIGADLTNANFYGATLFHSDLTGSTMINTDLRFSTLTRADLSFVNLDGADLDGAGTWSTNLNHCYNHPICR